ncbi:hypothetical protein FOZ60_008565 [Perkinsus olseni]|uniref:Mediator of RNA polymerase II transcription subunit 7 n=1 Tax=Perkinsus olseni TaxID=32597 RepID=A0A7J6NIZ4_PEROL|nr:hypothetical protein FOZ60_008565 [Perkinsus olseni]
MSATAPESGDPSAILWPPPPPYYKLFQPGKEDQWPEPPSPDEISKLTNDKGMYMMLGRVMEDCRNPAVKITVPEIDSDLLRYDPSSTSLKREMGKLGGGATRCRWACCWDGLRQFETLVKSLYHGLEILRGHEAKRLALQLAREQVEDLRSTLEDIRAATAQGREALGPVKDELQPIDEIVSVKTEVAPSAGDPSPKRRKRR